MRPNLLLVALLSASCVLGAQTPTPAQSAPAQTSNAATPSAGLVTFTSDAGFSYSYPSDWTVIDSKPMMPAVQMEAKDTAAGDLERKGVDCTQIGLLLRNSSTQSSIIVLVLPYSCVGTALKQSDLPAAAAGMAEGIKKSYDVRDPQYAAYKLGKFSFAALRSLGTSKAHPELTSTIETTCGMLSKAMVCWMGFARNEAALSVLESGKTTLEGEAALPLVPSTAFGKKQN